MDPLALPEAVKQTRLSPPQIIAAISRSDAERADKRGRILDTCMMRMCKYILQARPCLQAASRVCGSEDKEANALGPVLFERITPGRRSGKKPSR